MSEPVYRRVAATTDVAAGKMLCVELDGRRLLICHVDGDFFAVDATCSHAEESMHEGRLRGHRLLCPVHGAAFDVRDGSVLRPPATRPIESHPVRIDGDEVQVALSD